MTKPDVIKPILFEHRMSRTNEHQLHRNMRLLYSMCTSQQRADWMLNVERPSVDLINERSIRYKWKLNESINTTILYEMSACNRYIKISMVACCNSKIQILCLNVLCLSN